jgi:hypothetical protein
MADEKSMMEMIVAGIVLDDDFRSWALGKPDSVKEIFGISDRQVATLKKLKEVDPRRIGELKRVVKDPKAFAAGIAVSADIIKDIGVAAEYY